MYVLATVVAKARAALEYTTYTEALFRLPMAWLQVLVKHSIWILIDNQNENHQQKTWCALHV